MSDLCNFVSQNPLIDIFLLWALTIIQRRRLEGYPVHEFCSDMIEGFGVAYTWIQDLRDTFRSLTELIGDTYVLLSYQSRTWLLISGIIRLLAGIEQTEPGSAEFYTLWEDQLL